MRPRFVTLLLDGNGVPGDALKAWIPDHVQGKDSSTIPKWPASMEGRAARMVSLPYCTIQHTYPASVASIWSCPSWLKCLQHGQVTSSHICPQVVQFSMNTVLLWLTPSPRSLGAHGLGYLLFPKGGPCLFLHMETYNIYRWHYKFAKVFQNQKLHEHLVTWLVQQG